MLYISNECHTWPSFEGGCSSVEFGIDYAQGCEKDGILDLIDKRIDRQENKFITIVKKNVL